MKRTVRVLPRATYIGTGNTRTYLHAVELCEVLGQGDTANSTNTPAPEFDLEVWVTVVVEG